MIGDAAYMDFALYDYAGDSPTAFWIARPFITGSSATVTVSSASTTRIAGTFSFTAVSPGFGVAPSTRTVTNGAFDLSQ